MPVVDLYNSAREKIGTVDLDDSVFAAEVKEHLFHMVVRHQLAARRQGTHATKRRAEVAGGGRKPWKQKGTGRARAGSTRAPHWRGGGVVFGPQPRSYTQIVPKQVRALARKSALNARARENAVILVDALNYSAPKTKTITSLLASLGVADKKVLLLTDGVKPNVYLSARNLGRAHVMPFSDASTYHILWSDVVVIESSALTQTSSEG